MDVNYLQGKMGGDLFNEALKQKLDLEIVEGYPHSLCLGAFVFLNNKGWNAELIHFFIVFNAFFNIFMAIFQHYILLQAESKNFGGVDFASKFSSSLAPCQRQCRSLQIKILSSLLARILRRG